MEEGGGELTDYGYDSEDGREAGQRVSDLLRGLSDEHLGLKYGFSAAVKKVSIDRGADDSEKALTIVFDRVSWNPKFTDGGDAEPTLNPTKKWETLHCAEVVALASPGSGRLAMSTDQLITYVHRRVSDDPQTMPYFSFYFAGGSLVAIDEWYLP